MNEKLDNKIMEQVGRFYKEHNLVWGNSNNDIARMWISAFAISEPFKQILRLVAQESAKNAIQNFSVVGRQPYFSGTVTRGNPDFNEKWFAEFTGSEDD